MRQARPSGHTRVDKVASINNIVDKRYLQTNVYKIKHSEWPGLWSQKRRVHNHLTAISQAIS